MKALLSESHSGGCSAPGTKLAVRRRGGFRGFSLAELLVVIAMMSIMAAMLLPALSKAKHQITAAACFSNHKQLVTAFHLYAQDNGDRIVQMADYQTGDVIYPAGGFWGGPASGPPWETGEEALAATESGLRNSNAFYAYCGDVRMYHCPGDLRMTRAPGHEWPKGWGYDSYSRTQNLGGEPEDNYWGAGATFTKMSSIPSPGLTFSMMESADWRGYNVGTWIVAWIRNESFEWRRPPAIWHVNISSIGFSDGHAELHRWVDRRLVSAGRRAGEGGDDDGWFGPTSGPDYDYVYNGYRFPGRQ